MRPVHRVRRVEAGLSGPLLETLAIRIDPPSPHEKINLGLALLPLLRAVPLVLRFPGNAHRSRRISTVAQTIRIPVAASRLARAAPVFRCHALNHSPAPTVPPLTGARPPLGRPALAATRNGHRKASVSCTSITRNVILPRQCQPQSLLHDAKNIPVGALRRHSVKLPIADLYIPQDPYIDFRSTQE